MVNTCFVCLTSMRDLISIFVADVIWLGACYFTKSGFLQNVDTANHVDVPKKTSHLQLPFMLAGYRTHLVLRLNKNEGILFYTGSSTFY